jgi:hypothetical protein
MTTTHLWTAALLLLLGAGAGAQTLEAAPPTLLLPAGQPLGTTTLRWRASSGAQGEVTVRRGSGPETLFAGGPSGSQAAPWIQRGDPYTFTLYDVRGGSRTRAAEVVVRALEQPAPGVGLNAVDLFMQVHGFASGGAGPGDAGVQRVTLRLAAKRLAEARDLGLPLVRAAASGYDARELAPWRDDPLAYWGRVDALVDLCEAEEVQLVPVLLWNATQFPAFEGESLRDLVVDPSSASRATLLRFVTELVTRYRHRRVVAFWELTNELNLLVDLDLAGRNPGRPEWGNFGFDEMARFCDDVASHVRALDPARPISSGFAAPRPSAQHLRHRPEFGPGGPDWTRDSEAELTTWLADAHRACEIVSVHVYNGDGDHARFGVTGSHDAGLIDVLHRAAASAGKPLYVGEFGDSAPTLDRDPRGLFSRDVLRRVAALRVPWSAPWAWEFYQFETHRADAYSLEPGLTDGLIDAVVAADQALGGGRPPRVARPPRVVLTWPLDGASVDAPRQRVHVSASDEGAAPARVELLLDGALVHAWSRGPYEVDLDTSGLGAGPHRLVARAIDQDGQAAEDAVTVRPAGITASPEQVVVPPGAGVGSTTLAWDTGAGPAEVWVSMDGAPEAPMAGGGRRGTATATWIQPGHTYRFRLWTSDAAGRRVVGEVLVTGAR